MSLTVVIHQPDFLPHFHFFQRLVQADKFIVLDHVQFLNNSKSWHHRDKIKTEQGPKWITVSVDSPGQKTPLNQVRILNDKSWRVKILNLVAQNYRKSPFFLETFAFLEECLFLPTLSLSEYNFQILQKFFSVFQIQVEIYFSSNLDPQYSKNEMLIDLIQKVGGNKYLTGLGSKAYLDENIFSNNGIEVLWQQIEDPHYPQLYGDFIPHLSIIDMIFNIGFEKTRKTLFLYTQKEKN